MSDDGYNDMMNWLNSREPVRKDEPGRRYPTILIAYGVPMVAGWFQPAGDNGPRIGNYYYDLDFTTQSIEIPGIGTVYLN